MLGGVHPMLAYAMVGLGAAAYSPAKYGIMTDVLPAEKLVVANAWLESATVLSTIVGTMAGGLLISDAVSHWLGVHPLPLLHSAAQIAMLAMMLVYAFAGLLNIGIPDTGARYENRLHHPGRLVADFRHCFIVLWSDKLAQIALWGHDPALGQRRHAAIAGAQVGERAARHDPFGCGDPARRHGPGHRRGGGMGRPRACRCATHSRYCRWACWSAS